MTVTNGPARNFRNKNYNHSHRLLIETTADLITESGADGVSVLALARVTGVNRSTIYYHFSTREKLMSAAQEWSDEQSAKGVEPKVSRWIGIEHLSDFLRDNPGAVASWIDNSIAGGDIRDRYPQWDRLVAQLGDAFAELSADDPCDAEVYCALMLTSAFFFSRAFANSVHPFDSMERILERLHVSALAQAGLSHA